MGHGHNDVEEVRKLIMRGADVNAVDHEGWSVLRWAVEYSQVDIVQLLLKQRADVNEQDEMGRTVLMDAVQEGEVEIVKLLLSYGAEVGIETDTGRTVMDIIRDDTHPEIKVSLFEAQRKEEELFRFVKDGSQKDGGQRELLHKKEDEDVQVLEQKPCVHLLVNQDVSKSTLLENIPSFN